jgi:hypothetical protein
MAENPYRKSYDRQAVLFDKKIRLIDLTDFTPELPDVGIYDEPLRYFAANEQWCKLIFGWLTFMQEEAFWPDAEGQDYAGIQAILIFEQGVDVATKDDIRDGMYEAMNRLAAQIVSGRFTNIAVGDDGTVSDPTDTAGDAGLPEDDPTTIIDETESARMGGTINLDKAIELLLDKVDTYYGATNGTPTTSQADAQTLVKAFFDCDGTAMDTAIATYYTYRASNNRILFNVSAAFHEYMYCHGSNERAWGQWLVDQSAYTTEKISVIQGLTVSLSDAFWADYYQAGLSKPSTTYLEASCVPSPTEIMNMPVLGTSYSTQQVWKANHRLLVTIENYFTDTADSDVLDFFWYDTTAATPVNRISSVTMQQGAGITKPTTNQVPFNSNHKYQFTLDLGANSGVLQLSAPATGMTTPVASVAGVGFQVTVVDLGEIAL